MKSYLVVFFVLWSFVGFGQMEIPQQCYLKFCSPESSLGFAYSHYNHFQDLFPPNKLKKNEIKSVKIVQEQLNETKPIFNYYFDKNGYVNIFERYENNSQTIYERENRVVLRRLYLNNEDKRDTSILYYTYDSSTLIMSYDFPGNHIGQGVSNYFFDDKNRVNQTIYYVRVSGNIIDSSYTKYVYNDNDLSCYFQVRNEDFHVQFNEYWQPIKEQNYKDSVLRFETQFTYNLLEQLIQYSEVVLTPIPIKDETGNWILPANKSEMIYIEETKKILFRYNSKGLLEKIIQTTDDETCEYRVYYYTE